MCDCSPLPRLWYDAFRAEYVRAGAPYGKNLDGLLRWQAEQIEIRQAQRRAEHDREIHDAAAALQEIERLRKVAVKAA